MASPAKKDVRGLALLIVVATIVLGGIGFGVAPKPWLKNATRIAFAESIKARLIGRVQKRGHEKVQRLRELDARFKQGVTMLHAGRHEFAVTAFARVIELDPRIPEAHANLGFALLGTKDYRNALASFERALDIRDRQMNAYYGMALALQGLENYGGAAAALQTYLHLAPKGDRFHEQAKVLMAEMQEKFTEQRMKAPPGPSPEPTKDTPNAQPK